MTQTSSSRRVSRLLDAVCADFPRRKAAAEALMRRHGLDDTLELVLSPSVKARSVPTFDRDRRRRPSPMLRARFEYAGTIGHGLDTWLGPAEMGRWMRKREVRLYHRALREHWEGSAPQRFPDGDLTLFAVTEDVPDSLTYLVWRAGRAEPEVWSYLGMGTHRFKDLAAYLTWVLERELVCRWERGVRPSPACRPPGGPYPSPRFGLRPAWEFPCVGGVL